MIHQSGLYAGSTGFNISVGNTTTLEGALLSSKTDRNILKTKQLVMKDMKNRAKYTYGSKGVSYLADPTIGKSSKQYNELGLVPTIMPGERGKANSITYSAIAKGVLDVEHPEVNLNAIRRNTEDSLHTLATIFDKQGIAERQETAKLFSKYMNEAIHRFGEMKDAKGQRIYKDGSSEKVALHALSGAITSAIVKGNPTTGALSGGLNEALIQSISKLAKDHPARAQLLSASLGYTVDKLLGGDGLEGASIAQAGTKWNSLLPQLENDLHGIGSTLFTLATLSSLKIDSAGKIIDKYGNILFESYNELVVYLRWDGKLKKMPKKVIDDLGGEDYTQEVKRNTGKSKSDLYWNPKTGDVYAVPKNGKGEAEWVDNVEVDKD